MRTYHDTTDAMAAIEAMAERLRDDYGAEAVILYGSRANGSARPDSDIDLLIIKDDAPGGAFKRSRRAEAFLSDIKEGYYLDTHVASTEQLEDMLARGNHFVQDVILHGKPLFENGCFGRLVELARESYNMNPQETDFPEYWLRIADRDYNRTLLLFDNDDPEGAGFHLQQATEKFFKAYLIRQGWRLVRTHNLVDLLGEALLYDPSLEEFVDVCDEVRKYSFASRYPWEDRWGDPPNMSDDSVRAVHSEIEPLLERLRAGSAKQDSDGQDKQDDG